MPKRVPSGRREKPSAPLPRMKRPAVNIVSVDDDQGGEGAPVKILRFPVNNVVPTGTTFDVDFMPCDGTARRARRQLIEQMIVRVGDKSYLREADPFEAAELRRQEAADNTHLDAIRAACGKKADWRVSLCFEARSSPGARRELSERTTMAALFDAPELRRFVAASEIVHRTIERGLWNRSKLAAILFGFLTQYRFKRLPTRAETKQHLKENGFSFPSDGKAGKGANDKRFFDGPYLSLFPRGKPWSVS